MSFAVIATAVVGAGISVGLAAASKPNFTNPASSSRKVALAGLKALPGQRQVEMAARLGQEVDYATGKSVPTYETRQMTRADLDNFRLAGKIDPNEYTIYDRQLSAQEQQQKEASNRNPNAPAAPPPSVNVRFKTGNKPETRHADFRGYGDADVQGQLARSMAKIQLDLQKKYGTDFVDEAKRQQEQADPEGTAARRLLADKINAEDAARKTRTHPVADTLESQVRASIASGRNVDPESAVAAERVLARRGDTTLHGGDVTTELAAGPQGDARLRERLQQGMSYYGSGQSPTDIAYRDEQQSMANMASFLGGRTPQSQFGGLRNAQQGASPLPQGPGLPGVDPNLQQNAQNAGLQSYQAGVRSLAGNVNPWFVGLNGIVNGIGAYQAAGRRAQPQTG